jgi:hypothetical protein
VACLHDSSQYRHNVPLTRFEISHHERVEVIQLQLMHAYCPTDHLHKLIRIMHVSHAYHGLLETTFDSILGANVADVEPQMRDSGVVHRGQRVAEAGGKHWRS